jgi:hypothetical protein
MQRTTDRTKTLTSRRASVVALVLASTLSACGSSRPSTTARAAFVARADAVCASGIRKAQRLTPPKSPSELLPFIEQAETIVHRILTELQTVTPPAGSRAAYIKFLATAEQETKTLRVAVTALRGHNFSLAKSALASLNSNTSNAEAAALGLSQCARTATPEVTARSSG